MTAGFGSVLRKRAEAEPDAVAFAFGEAASLTYGELLARAEAAGKASRPGERVMVVLPPGPEYVVAVWGCLLRGAVAVPAAPPFGTAAAERLSAIVADAGPGAVEIGDVALLQYTSGSTARPRGVRVTHANLFANCSVIERCFALTRESRGVIWLPPYHDMGLIGGLLQPVFTGFPCLLLSPLEVVRRPARWLQAVSDFRATVSGGPDFAYALCARRASPEGLDLSRWRVAFTGAEPVRAGTLDAFTAAFAPAGFRREALYPCYGLAEATLMVTGGDVDAAPLVRDGRVGCGRAAPGHEVRVVDPDSHAPADEGEVWVRGPSVADGYHHGPGFDAVTADGDGPYLRTGDLGFLADGELFVTGRIKDVIIVAGRKHHAVDVEQACERGAEVRPGCGGAFAVEADGAEGIGIVYEVRPGADAQVAIAAIRRAVAGATGGRVAAVALVERGAVPKTSSGKVQRHRCRDLLADGHPAVVARWRIGD